MWFWQVGQRGPESHTPGSEEDGVLHSRHWLNETFSTICQSFPYPKARLPETCFIAHARPRSVTHTLTLSPPLSPAVRLQSPPVTGRPAEQALGALLWGGRRAERRKQQRLCFSKALGVRKPDQSRGLSLGKKKLMCLVFLFFFGFCFF